MLVTNYFTDIKDNKYERSTTYKEKGCKTIFCNKSRQSKETILCLIIKLYI